MVDEHLDYLAEAAVAGDRAALGELVTRTQDRVRRLCALLASPAEADDLTQDTYLRALDSLHRWRGDAHVEVWLLAIARHVCADHIRTRTRRSAIRDRNRHDLATPSSVPADQLGDYDDLLAALDHEQRDAFVLTQVLGLGYAEAATVCDCPVGTIRSRVARARAQLHDLLSAAERGVS